MAKADALKQFECLPNKVRKEGRKSGIVENIYIYIYIYIINSSKILPKSCIDVIEKYKYV